MDRLTVIGKVTIKDTSAVKEWFESKEAKRWFDENWAPTAPGELPSGRIGFYDLQSEIPGLYKYLERTCEQSYNFNDLISAASYYENLGQSFSLLYLDEKNRFAVICGANIENGWILPCKFLDVSVFRNYDNVTMSSLLAADGIHGENEPMLASDISASNIKDSILEKKQELQAKKDELDALKKEQEEKLLEYKRQLEAQYKKQTDLLAQKREELDRKMEELMQQLTIIETQIYAIRCLSGEVVEFSTLTSGARASEDMPVVVHQKLRFLDEELGKALAVYGLEGDNRELRYVEDILKTREDIRELFCPGEKAVSFVKVSRSGVRYQTSDIFANMLERYKKYHGSTIGILVKDGENLYMGWTDEDKINISNDNMFYAPKKEILQESEIFENSSQNDKVSRFYIFSILQGIINDGKLLRLPEKVKVTAPSPYIVFSMADGWIEDDTFGSWTDILNATAGELSKGDAVLTMQRIMRDDAMNYNRDSTQYAAFCNNRGRGEKNRTHDVHIADCTIYPINLVDKDILYHVYYLEYPYTSEEERYNKSKDGKSWCVKYHYHELQGPPKLIKEEQCFEKGLYYPQNCGFPYKTVSNDTIAEWVQWSDAYYGKNDVRRESRMFSDSVRCYKRIFFKAEYIRTESHIFISEEKADCRGAWDSSVKKARANMEVCGDEILNLTYLDSVRVRYVIVNRKINGLRIGGQMIDYAMALKYLNKALAYLLEREKEEEKMLRKYADELPDNWQVKLATWRREKGYHSLTNTRAKAFVAHICALD